ncbi:MAG: phage head-tail joining protein [Burkholderiaceae bacterium]
MALTQTDLDNLDAAIAAGELSVEVNGRKLVYRSVSDLLQARAHVSSVLAVGATQGSSPRRGSFRVTFTTARGD